MVSQWMKSHIVLHHVYIKKEGGMRIIMADPCGNVCRVKTIGTFYMCDLDKDHEGRCQETVFWWGKNG